MYIDSVFPAYCPVCGQLAFVVKSGPSDFSLVDITLADWNVHPCYFTKPKTVENDPAVAEILRTDRFADRLPFQWRKSPPNCKDREGAVAVITGIKASEEKRTYLEAVTSNNESLIVKALFPTDDLRVGAVLDARERVRIGKGRYRLQHCRKISSPMCLFDRPSIPNEHYRLVISSTDQEKLEVFVDRVLHFFDQEGIASLLVIPLLLEKRQGIVYHRRQISFMPTEELMKKFSQLPIPDHIFLSIHQTIGS